MIASMRVSNFLGIELAEYRFTAAGGIFEGDNGTGKSSALKAIRAALTGQGVGPDAIHLGADKSTIFVDLAHETVKRVITPSGSRVHVTRDDGPDPTAPQRFLSELVGVAPLDPIELIEQKPADRRAAVLRAIPLTVDAATLRRWIGEELVDVVVDTTGHGLEVVDRARKQIESLRRDARPKVEAAGEIVSALAVKVATLEERSTGAGSVDETRDALAVATAKRSELAAREVAASKAEAATARTRERIEKLTREASTHEEHAKGADEAEATVLRLDDEIDDGACAENAAADRVMRLERELQAAKVEMGAARNATEVKRAERQIAQREYDSRLHANGEAKRLREEIAALQDTIGHVTPPTDEEIEAAKRAEGVALDAFELAKVAQEGRVERQRLDEACAHELAVKRRFTALDAACKRLANDAPRALLASAGEAFAGLSLEGDTIKIDGVSIDSLSTKEQLVFAVELARRLNHKSKLLIVDRLEAVSPAELPAFVKMATRDGYQLIAARVGVGPARLIPIDADGSLPSGSGT